MSFNMFPNFMFFMLSGEFPVAVSAAQTVSLTASLLHAKIEMLMCKPSYDKNLQRQCSERMNSHMNLSSILGTYPNNLYTLVSTNIDTEKEVKITDLENEFNLKQITEKVSG